MNLNFKVITLQDLVDDFNFIKGLSLAINISERSGYETLFTADLDEKVFSFFEKIMIGDTDSVETKGVISVGEERIFKHFFRRKEIVPKLISVDYLEEVKKSEEYKNFILAMNELGEGYEVDYPSIRTHQYDDAKFILHTHPNQVIPSPSEEDISTFRISNKEYNGFISAIASIRGKGRSSVLFMQEKLEIELVMTI